MDDIISDGIIEDPVNVFKLAMIERELENTKLRKQLMFYQTNEQIAELIAKQKQFILQFDADFNELREKHTAHKAYIEQIHNISLADYVYDDELGIFKFSEYLSNEEE